MNYLLDTNVISELIKKQPNRQVIRWIDEQDAGRMYLSVVTIGEVQKGITKLSSSERKNTLQTWLDTDLRLRFDKRILELTSSVMTQWGRLTGTLELQGRVLSAFDSLIAATCLQHQAILVTRNEDDFQGTGVTIINPWNIPAS
ncbi:MAG: type II toxin-antitoxin system VapC family toxin [Candidatus Viridilinea halotolerans]|uniref:Type II toxin-antitoxin system VapC family toxin n=1 Tax=Candidatus Viridilinea halotolerans TaxID=2491704 RepID=A0A426UBU9_9CHLR|nr:MAG: type II toxin-antitoxin system VapC family toxin [Candidatus Viridilinea halotolerans]